MFQKILLENIEMDFKNEVRNIQTAAYNGVCTNEPGLYQASLFSVYGIDWINFFTQSYFET